MYRIVDGVKTPYNVLSAREALELSLNDAEREEFCKIIDCIYELSLNSSYYACYTWYYDPKRRWEYKVNDDKILTLLKYYGYSIHLRHIKTESGLYVYDIDWGTSWKED